MKWIGFLAVKASQQAWQVLILALVLCLLSGVALLTLMRFEPDQTALVTRDAPFWRPLNQFYDEFPQLKRTAMIVIESDSIDAMEDTSLALIDRLRVDHEKFDTIFMAEESPFFATHALLFLETDKLTQIVDRLAKAQPALGAVAEDPSLRGFISLIDVGITAIEDGTQLPTAFADVMNESADAVRQIANGDDTSFSWGDQILDDEPKTYRRVIIVQPKDVHLTQANDNETVRFLREVIQEQEFTSKDNVTIRVTGRLALAYDEIQAVKDSVSLAGFLSFVSLAIILAIGLPSWRLIIGTVVTLAVGLILSMGFAAVAVGSLNLVSATFAVLFVGLGIDHALHMGLRYDEFIRLGKAHIDAMRDAALTTGGAVLLCAITTALGLAAFIPTDFLGIAQLGLIASAGMGFAFLASMTVLPALLTVMNADKHPMKKTKFMSGATLIRPRRRFAVVGAVMGGIALIYVAVTGINFNFSTLAIRDPQSESVSALRDLQQDKVVTDFVAAILAKDATQTAELKAKLDALPEVDQVRTPYNYVAEDQEEKLAILDDAIGFLWPILIDSPEPKPLNDQERMIVVDDFLAKVAKLGTDNDAERAVHNIADAFREVRNQDDANLRLADIEHNLIGRVKRQLDRLKASLEADFYEYEDLPSEIRARLISANGVHRLSALPAHDITDVDSLAAFVYSVKSVAPNATGRPAVEHGVGGIVVESFAMAGLIAFLAITAVLLFMLRNIYDTLLVLLPIILAGLLMVATANIFGVFFNFANIIALPLIFGLGVDSAIHLVIRNRMSDTTEEVVSSSTPQAVLLSSLTTFGAFASLSFSAHYGLASMGMLLTIGIIWLLFSTLLVLPGLLKAHALASDN